MNKKGRTFDFQKIKSRGVLYKEKVINFINQCYSHTLKFNNIYLQILANARIQYTNLLRYI